MLVSKPTYGGGAPLGIDLDAGIATIKISRPAPAAEDEASPAEETAAPDPDPATAPDDSTETATGQV